MNEIDERQQERDRERARQEDERRLAEQLRHADALGAVRRGQVKITTDNLPRYSGHFLDRKTSVCGARRVTAVDC